MTDKEYRIIQHALNGAGEVMRTILGTNPCDAHEDPAIIDAFYAMNTAWLRIAELRREGGDN